MYRKMLSIMLIDVLQMLSWLKCSWQGILNLRICFIFFWLQLFVCILPLYLFLIGVEITAAQWAWFAKIYFMAIIHPAFSFLESGAFIFFSWTNAKEFVGDTRRELQRVLILILMFWPLLYVHFWFQQLRPCWMISCLLFVIEI